MTLNRLHLTSPNTARRYIAGGRGEQVNFIRVPENLGLSALQEDVANGANHFAALLPLAREINTKIRNGDDSSAQLVILEADCAEDGRMAAAYLESVAYQAEQDRLLPDFSDDRETEEDQTFVSAAYSWEEENEEEDGLIQDAGVTVGEEDEEVQDEEDQDFADVDYMVSPLRIPILDFDSLGALNVQGAEPEILFGNMQNAAMTQYRRHMPYWTRLHGGSVLIEDTFRLDLNPFHQPPRENVDFEDRIARFLNCRRIYLVVLGKPNKETAPFFDEDAANRFLQTIGMYRILYAAKDLTLHTTKARKDAYYRNIFLSCLAAKQLTLPKRINENKMIAAISQFANDGLCSALSGCVDYVAMQARGGKNSTAAWRSLETIRAVSGLEKPAEDVESLQSSSDARENYRKHFLYRDDVLSYFARFLDALKLQKLRAGKYHITSNDQIHNTLLFLGAPGTGKSESAKYLAKMLYEEKLIPGKVVVTVSGAQLKAPYVGQTAPRVRALVAKADILFVDEIYSLMSSDGLGETDSYSKEALAELLLCIEENPKKVFILAGYGGTDEKDEDDYVKSFLQENPGLRSRISMTIPFRSYREDELVAITHLLAKEQDLELSNAADPILASFFEKRKKCANFGNARDARNLVVAMHRQAVHRLAARYPRLNDADLSRKELSALTVEDAKNAVTHLLSSSEQLSGTAGRHFGFV